MAESESASSIAQTPEVPGLPRLNYNLRDHKTKLSIVSTLLIVESSLLPIALYYGLWFGTSLRHGIREFPRTQPDRHFPPEPGARSSRKGPY
jgi:hypothetical protein